MKTNNIFIKTFIIFTTFVFCETQNEIYELRKKAEIYNHEKNDVEALKIYLKLFEKDQSNYEFLKKIRKILISNGEYELLIEKYIIFIKNSTNKRNIFEAEVDLIEIKIWNKDNSWNDDLYTLDTKYQNDNKKNYKFEYILHKIFNNAEIINGYNYVVYLREKYNMPSFFSRKLISIFKKNKYFKESIDESIIFLNDSSNKKISTITKTILIDQIYELIENMLNESVIKDTHFPISAHNISSNKFLNIKSNYNFDNQNLNYIQNTYNILIKNNLQPEIAQLKKAEIQFHIYNDLDSAYKILDRLDKNSSKIDTKIRISIMKSDILISKGYLDSASNLIDKNHYMLEKYLNKKKLYDTQYKNLEISLYKGDYKILVNDLDSLINNFDLNNQNYNDLLELKMITLFFKEDIELFKKYSQILYKLKMNKSFEAILDLIDLINSKNILISELAQFQYALIELQKGNIANVQKIISEINSNTVYYEISLILNAEIEDYINKNHMNAIKLYEMIINKFPDTIYKEDIIRRLNIINKEKIKDFDS